MEDKEQKVDVNKELVDNQAEATPASEEKQGADSSSQEEKIDYKKRYEEISTELDNVSHELNQAKFTLTQKNKAEKESRKKQLDNDFEDDDTGDDDEPNKDITDIVREEVEKAQLLMRKDIITEEIDRLTSDSDEKDLIKLFYDRKIVKTGFDKGSIRKDLEYAQILANQPRLNKVMSEIQKKKESEEAIDYTSGSGGHKIKSDSISKVNLSDKDKALMAKYGLKPEDIKS